MANLLARFQFQWASFLLGLAAGMLLFWLLQRFQPALRRVFGSLRARFTNLRKGFTGSVESRFRLEAYHLYATNHLADPLFSMAQVAIPPRLTAPPPPVLPGEALPPETITDMAVPYLPDLPEVGGLFQIKTLTIQQAMSRGANLLLFGPAGSGRTFAMSSLAGNVALRDPQAGDLADLVPFYLHAGGLDLAKRDRPAQVIYHAFASRVSILLEASLEEFIQSVLEKQLALVLVDGLDELLPEARAGVVAFLQKLQQAFPGNRYIVSTSPNDLSAQTPLRLFPFAIAGWTPDQKQHFIRNWGALWQSIAADQPWASELDQVFDPVILNAWLSADTAFSSPFDLTLKTWAAYAGDSRGPTEVAAIDAYLERMSAGIRNARPALENLAAQSALNATPFLKRRNATGYIATFEEIPAEEAEQDELALDEALEEVEALLAEVSTTSAAASPPSATGGPLDDDDLDSLLEELEDLEIDPESGQIETLAAGTPAEQEAASKPSGRSLLPRLIEAGLLVEHPNGLIGFSHPLLAGYLAGAGLTTTESLQTIDGQPAWTGRQLALRFLPHYQVDMTGSLARALEKSHGHPLQPELVEASTWLRHVAGAPAWRTNFMRSLAASIQDDALPIGLRARLLVNLVFSGVGGVNKLLRQLLHSPQHSVRWLGALGCGLTRDPAALEDLTYMLYQPAAYVNQAACLALATYGSQRALEALTQALVDASDEVRRAAAEALALHPDEGHPVLRDGATVKDVAVRRAVVYGLASVREDWAREILLQLQTADDQWVVRNAAIQINEDLKLDEIAIPGKLPPLHETGWLLRYASEKGMGLSPGQASWDMLAAALREGSEEARLAAMYVYRLKPEEARPVLEPLVELMRGGEGELREAAYHTLWHLDANQVALQG
jgi:hypothetical protein